MKCCSLFNIDIIIQSIICLEQHISHLRMVPDPEINRLLGMVVDVENIYMSMQKEEDPDTKRVYFYLFKLLRKCIVTMTKPTIEGPLGQPPFERPSIAKAVTNFVLHKFGHLAQRVCFKLNNNLSTKMIF